MLLQGGGGVIRWRGGGSEGATGLLSPGREGLIGYRSYYSRARLATSPAASAALILVLILLSLRALPAVGDAADDEDEDGDDDEGDAAEDRLHLHVVPPEAAAQHRPLLLELQCRRKSGEVRQVGKGKHRAATTVG